MRWIIVNCDRKKEDRVLWLIALTSAVFVCTALIQQGIQTATREPNIPSAISAGAVETNRSARAEHPALGNAETVHKTGAEHRAHDKQSVAKTTDEGKASTETGRTAAEDEAKTAGKTKAKAKTKASLPSGKIVRGYGWQADGGVWRYHTGIDMTIDSGIVCAPSDGTVRRAQKRAGGYLVEIDAHGTLWRYEPLAETTAAVGDTIRRGDEIGRIAAGTDRLHIACRRGGKWTDPQTAGR